MARYHCCWSRRTTSSTLPNAHPVQLIDNTGLHGRFSLSTASNTETLRSPIPADQAESKRCSIASNAHNLPQEQFVSLGQPHGQTSECRPRGRESFTKVRDVAGKVKRSMSKDSNVSRIRTETETGNRQSHEDLQRRQELKRAKHRRLRSDLLNDDLDEEESYDKDTISMKNPRRSESRQEHPSIPNLQKFNGSRSEVCTQDVTWPQSKMDMKNGSLTMTGRNDTAGTLSRILTIRGSRISANAAHEHRQEFQANTIDTRRSLSANKYVFSPDSSPRNILSQASFPDQGPMHEESDYFPTAPAPNALPAYPDTPRAPSMPTLATHCIGNGIDLSAESGPLRSTHTEGTKSTNDDDETNRTIRQGNGPAREHWAMAATGSYQDSAYHQGRRSRSDGHRSLHSHYQHISDLDTKGSSSSTSSMGERSRSREYLRMPGAYPSKHLKKQSSGSDEVSLHAYKTDFPEHLLRSELVSPLASIHHEGDRENLHSSDSNCALKRQTSAPERQITRMPLSWNGVHTRRTASSIYSQESKMVTPAQRTSYSNLGEAVDRSSLPTCSSSPQDGSGHTTSFPASTISQCDLHNVDRSIRDHNPPSDDESCLACPKRSTEGERLLVGDNVSHYKTGMSQKDIEEIAAEIASTNPSRKASLSHANLDGNNERRHASVRSRANRNQSNGNLHVAPPNESAWERAIREHAKEDLLLERTRVGSNEHLISPRPCIEPRRSNSVNMKEDVECVQNTQIDRLSSEVHRVDSLQAKLGAYELPRPLSALETLQFDTHSYLPNQDLLPSLSPKKRNTKSAPLSTWSRYPSFDRAERSDGSAGERDNVLTRDFAEESTKLRSTATEDVDPAATNATRSEVAGRGRRRKSKSMTFSKSVMNKLSVLYRASSMELNRKYAYGSHGHRSSISQGRAIEYPELEMLAPISPQLPSQGTIEVDVEDMELDREEANVLEQFGKVHVQGSRSTANTGLGANRWIKLYQDCVVHPDDIHSAADVSNANPRSHSLIGSDGRSKFGAFAPPIRDDTSG